MAFENKISTQTLFDVALARKLSPLMERAWELRTKVNPVANLMLYTRAVEQSKVNSRFFLAAASAVFTAGITILAFEWKEASLTSSWWWAQFLIILVSAGIPLWAGEIVCRVYTRYSKAEVESFCADLGNLERWLVQANLFLWSSDEEALKDGAFRILVQAARDCRNSECSQEASSKGINYHAEALRLLALKYDTLQRLGLTSGGYGKYYVEADRLLAESNMRKTGTSVQTGTLEPGSALDKTV